MLAGKSFIVFLSSVGRAAPALISDLKIKIPSTLDLAAVQLKQLAFTALQTTRNTVADQSGECNLRTLRVRRDWREFSRKERREYIEAILCLQRLPSQTPPDLAPGAKSRYDDYVSTHINQTTFIHRSVGSSMN